ncbi:hypothetical protein Tco_0513591 [Tanacetum coccineum]
MMHSISPCHVFIPAMSAYSFTMYHLASCLPPILHAFCMVSYKGDLYKLLLVQVMAAPNIPVSAEENLGDPIDIRVDIIYPDPVAAVAFPAAIVVRTLAQHGEAIQGMQGHLIKTTEAIEKVTRNHKRQALIKIEQQLAAVQESHRQDREDLRKFKELVTSQFG